MCVSVLESATQQQQACLMYKAASDNTQDIVLGKKLHKSSAPVSIIVRTRYQQYCAIIR